MQNRTPLICLFAILFVGISSVQGQPAAKKQGRAEKISPAEADSLARMHFMEGRQALDTGNVHGAYMAFHTAVRYVPKFREARLALAELLDSLCNYNRSYVEWASMTKLYPGCSCYEFCAGRAAFRSGQYEESRQHLEAFVGKSGSADSIRMAEEFIAMCAPTRPEILQRGVSVPQAVKGRELNTRLDEYYPAVKAGGGHMVYTRLLPKKGTVRPKSRQDGQEDIFYSRRLEDGTWSEGKTLSERFESSDDESAAHFSEDGYTVFYTECDRHCRIMQSHMGSDGRWSRPSPVPGEVNGSFDSKAAVLSPDGKQLYFASNRPGGEGKFDIWVAHLSPNGRWDSVANVGPTVNTLEDELAPHLSADGKRLFFSSNGHKGRGGLDLFAAERQGDGWDEPYNLGYPINTKADELSFCLNGDTAYFASDRDRTRGWDIYQVAYGPKRPLHSAYVMAKVIDSASKRLLPAAITIIAVDYADTVAKFPTGHPATFTAYLANGPEFRMFIRRDGYLDKTVDFITKEEHIRENPLRLTIPLRPVPRPKVAKPAAPKPDAKARPAATPRPVSASRATPTPAAPAPATLIIHFGIGQRGLPANIGQQLREWVDYLSRNPNVRASVIGYTDNTGRDELNERLSKRRAESVKRYLVNKGVKASRLEVEGKGPKDPVATNETAEGRAQNRRVECRVLP